MRTLPVWDGIYRAEEMCRDMGLDLDIRFYVYEPQELMDGLRERSLDVLLTMPLPIMWQDEHFGSFQYAEMPHIMLVRKDHPLLDPKLSEEETITQILQQLPVASWDTNADIPGRNREYLSNWQGSGRIISSLEHYANADSAIMAAQKGECVLFGPAGWSAADNPRFAVYSLGKMLDYHCIWCKDQMDSGMNQFIEACKKVHREEKYFSTEEGAS
jgi:DNA-binding transcriptional LysR family regulator